MRTGLRCLTLGALLLGVGCLGLGTPPNTLPPDPRPYEVRHLPDGLTTLRERPWVDKSLDLAFARFAPELGAIVVVLALSHP